MSRGSTAPPIADTPDAEATPVRWLLVIVLAGLGAVLLGLIATHSLPAYLADTEPELALRLNPNEPNALLRLADRKLVEIRSKSPAAANPGEDGATTAAAGGRMPNFASLGLKPAAAGNGDQPADPAASSMSDEQRAAEAAAKQAAIDAASDEAQRLAERAIAASPLNARAFAILAELAERRGDMPRALEMSKAAMRRSLRESDAIYRLLRASFAAKDYGDSLRLADVLLRTRPSAAPVVMPLLARMAESAEARDQLKSMLIANPPWRARLFASLEGNITDARTPLDLLLSLKGTAHPPTTNDLRSYFDLLFRHNLHELAYYTWLQFLPPEQLSRLALLFNSGFDSDPSGLPFDWVIQARSGATVQFRRLPDADQGRGLHIEFSSGQVEFGGVAQIVMLSPGKYRLKGKYKGEISGRRGLRWRLTCVAGGRALLAETPMVLGAVPQWKEFEVPVTVPATDCRTQRLELILDARSASERLVSGSIWYKELDLRRSPETASGN